MMTTTRTSAQDLENEVRVWIEDNWDPSMTVREWWRRLANAGLAHPTWPEGTGGRGLSPSQARLITTPLGRCGAVAPASGHMGSTLAAPTILEHGTPDQIRRLLPPIARGETSWCQLFS